jgi:hypothetical protein
VFRVGTGGAQRCVIGEAATMSSDGIAVFAALDVGHTVAVDDSLTPTVVIDVADHPEVADLARVHAVEGVGDVTTVAMRDDDLVLLGVRLSVPVTAMFAVAFSYDAHRAFLGAVADAGQLTIATTDPVDAADDNPLWLAVDIDGAALLDAIDG